MDRENSQQAREFLRTYVNGNQKLITDWLDGSKNPEGVGSHLLCIKLERLAIDKKRDFSGIADGNIINLFQTVPGGDLAAGRLMARRLETGLKNQKNNAKLIDKRGSLGVPFKQRIRGQNEQGRGYR